MSLVLNGGAILPDTLRPVWDLGEAGRDLPFALTQPPQVSQRSLSGSASAIVVADEQITRAVSASLVTDYVLEYSTSAGGSEPVRTSSNESVIVPDPADSTRWSFVSAGQASLTLTAPGRTAVVPVTTSSQSSTVDTVTGYVEGSLIGHIHDAFAALLSGKTPSDTTQRLLNTDGARNSSLWAAGVDLSPLVIGHSGGWVQGFLVSELHVVVANHVGASVGSTYSFRRADNSGTVTRTIAATASIIQAYNGDILVVRLSAPITYAADGVRFAKVLPANAATKWKPGVGVREQTPIIKAKRNGGLQIGASMAVGIGSGAISASDARPAWMAPWYVEWTGGDSGSAVGTVINGEFVGLGCAWSGPGTEDDGLSNLMEAHSLISAVLAVDGYQLTDADLSAFPTYA